MDLLDRMRLDLARATLRATVAAPQLKVEAYLARLSDAEVWFEKVVA
jgi:hypothetical protein